MLNICQMMDQLFNVAALNLDLDSRLANKKETFVTYRKLNK